MSNPITRDSPLHDWHEQRRPHWIDIAGSPLAVRFQEVDNERTAMQSLALCDVSALPKLGVKGPEAPSFILGQGIEIPAEIYESRPLSDGGLIVRLPADEFVLQSGAAGELIPNVSSNLDAAHQNVFRIHRQEATFLLIGLRAIDVLAQTCGINFREAPACRLVFTRVAGVSCGVLPERVADFDAFRLWVDYTYAVYLWETLFQICVDLDGKAIGAGCVFPELL